MGQEVYNAGECALLKGARKESNKEGLDTSKLVCSAINLCDGSFCIYQSPIEYLGPPLEEVEALAEQFPEYRKVLLQDVAPCPQQIEDFYTRLEKHFEIVDKKRLEEIRQELASPNQF